MPEPNPAPIKVEEVLATKTLQLVFDTGQIRYSLIAKGSGRIAEEPNFKFEEAVEFAVAVGLSRVPELLAACDSKFPTDLRRWSAWLPPFGADPSKDQVTAWNERSERYGSAANNGITGIIALTAKLTTARLTLSRNRFSADELVLLAARILSQEVVLESDRFKEYFSPFLANALDGKKPAPSVPDQSPTMPSSCPPSRFESLRPVPALDTDPATTSSKFYREGEKILSRYGF